MVHKRDPRGQESTYAYRADGTVDTATRPGGGNLTMVAAIAKADEWDASGRPVIRATFTDDSGVAHQVTLNAAGRIERDVFTADGQAYDVQNVYQARLNTRPGSLPDYGPTRSTSCSRSVTPPSTVSRSRQ